MNFRNAKKLHNGDEVIVKKTGEVLTVVSAYVPRPMNMINRNQVFVECDDGNTYIHSDIK